MPAPMDISIDVFAFRLHPFCTGELNRYTGDGNGPHIRSETAASGVFDI